jgi:membrane associated rhomboid family serine protease
MQRAPRTLPYAYFNVTAGLIIVCVVVYLATRVSPRAALYLGLEPQLVTQAGFYWQLVTYMFVHDPRGIMHILMNMLGLYLFGIPLERRMGSWEFLVYYLVCGVGAGLVALVLGVAVIGASGAIYALLLAFATFFPQSRIYVMGVLPLQAPVAVAVFAGLSIFFQVTGLWGGVAHFAHLAGIVVGYLYFVLRLRVDPIREFLGR